MEITKDKIVTFNFRLMDEEGHVLDHSEQPSTYLHGYAQILPLLEEALAGKQAGENVKVIVPAEKGYGRRDEHLIRPLPRHQFANNEQLKPGMQVYSPQNQQFLMTIVEVQGENVIVDANHPLAGKNLIFEIAILSVRDATPYEIKNGMRS